MLKKYISLLTIVTFMIFSISCYSTKLIDASRINPKKKSKLKIFGLVTKTGKWIGFEGGDKGRIIDDFIIGETKDVSGELKIVRVLFENVSKVWLRQLNKTKTVHRLLGTYWGVMTVTFLIAIALGAEFMGD